mgnify:CR=1 FL=1
MAWPDESLTVDSVDWSWWNQIGNTGTKPIPVAEFVELNPSVDVYWLRACWPSGLPDKLYPVYYDAVVAAGKKVAAYVWPNVTMTIARVKENWKIALGDRVPKLVVGDFEEPSYGQDNAALTGDLHRSLPALSETFPNSVIAGYGRASWIDEKIRVPLPAGFPWIVAHYPMPYFSPEYRQYKTHDELHNNLPIGNSFTPTLGRRLGAAEVVGWQFSEYGYLPGWAKRMDLDSFKADFVETVYGDHVPPPEPSDPEKLRLLLDWHKEPHP